LSALGAFPFAVEGAVAVERVTPIIDGHIHLCDKTRPGGARIHT
jgi:hypothetical protein